MSEDAIANGDRALVTRDAALRLAELARSLEESGHDAERVAHFLMRAVFSMFVENMGLLPEGGFSPVLKKHLLCFNSELFESAAVLPLNESQIDLLIHASRADWKAVEPAIFGTLLERALDPVERHKLGAHYTPRAYVERLVMPAIIDPMREDWEAVRAASVTLADAGKIDEAVKEVSRFHEKLCRTRVLDPACGTGNFLYVTLEHMKRLEGEVLDALDGFQKGQMMIERGSFTVNPHQLLGIEINPRAAAIADLVLWIGYLQWQFRALGDRMPAEPVLKRFNNIECRDAVLACDSVEAVTDKRSGVRVLRYVNPRKAEWPEADYVVGNPPFIGKLKLLSTLGSGYVEALRHAYKGVVPDGSDYVMYWWHQAARLTSGGRIKRFGLITTNSITQTFNRKVLFNAFAAGSPIHLVFAIPDHPWIDTADSAAVRIAMTVGEIGKGTGTLATIASETGTAQEGYKIEFNRSYGIIHSDLRIGENVASAYSLKANTLIASTGLIPGSRGFVLTRDEAAIYRKGLPPDNKLIRLLRNGRDVTDIPRDLYVIDPDGWSEDELRLQSPAIYQRLLERVYPERQSNRDPKLRRQWWLFRRSNEQVRAAIADLPRYIATSETAKHRVFSFLESEEQPEHKLIVIGSDDAFILGVLSSRIHTVWALRSGALRGGTPVYVKTSCFEKFPFPVCDEKQRARIRELGEQLDAHRKRQQAQHSKLTITEMYNVLEKLRKDEPLTDREKLAHEQGLVSVLKQIHDELDRAVLDAYGWPAASLTDEEILTCLVRLNRERAAEERAGVIRWLRPEYQNPQGAQPASHDTEESAAYS